MKKNDLLLAGGLLLAGILTFFYFHLFSEPGNSVEIQLAGEVIGTYSLNEEQEIPIGEGNRLQIQNGEAHMEWADCPDALCIHQGNISRVGETIVCLPHQVVIEVIGEGAEPEVDEVAG